MLSTVACNGCGQTLRLHEGHDDRAAHCPYCEAPVPARPPAPPPPRPRRPRRPWLILTVVLFLLGLIAGTGIAVWVGMRRLRPVDALDLVADMGGERRPAAVVRGMLGPRGGHMNGDPTIELTGGKEVTLLESGRPPAWHQVGRLPPCLAAVADARRDILLTSTAEGELCWFSRRDYRRLGSVRLTQVAYQLALDPGRGLLYTASTDTADLVLAGLGDRDSAQGDIHCYDVSAILRGETPVGPLRPRATYEVGGHILTLLLAADGAHLYYLSEGGDVRAKPAIPPEPLRSQTSPFVGRIVPADKGQSRVLPVRSGGPTGLALAPDARVLYLLSGSRVSALDADQWTVQAHWPIGTSVYGLAALPGKRVLLLERRVRTQLIVYDLATRQPISRWMVPFEGRLYVRVAAAGDRIYLGSSALTRGQILALDIRGKRLLDPEVVRQAVSNGRRLLRGPIFLADDGAEVVTGAGHVFRTAHDAGRAGRAGPVAPAIGGR